MDKKSDVLLRKMLNNWVNRHHPPENGRARLLWEAAHLSRNKIDQSVIIIPPQFKSNPSSSLDDWHQTFYTWINENPLQLGIQARII